jgi:cytochrome b
MKKTKVYDLPTRLFHWTFAGLFLVAFGIAKLFDDESPVFSYHMLFGIIISAAVLWRIAWGFIGSRYARFSSFKLNPKDLLIYFRDFFNPKSKRYLGHNPASSWAAISMFTLALGLGLTGYMMAQGVAKDFYEDIHELLANIFIIVVIFHVAGVILHTIRHKDAIGLSMVHGNKDETAGAAGIGKSHYFAALFFVAFVSSFAFHLHKNYDPGSQNLNLFGTTLQLGEGEEAGEEDDD